MSVAQSFGICDAGFMAAARMTEVPSGTVTVVAVDRRASRSSRDFDAGVP